MAMTWQRWGQNGRGIPGAIGSELPRGPTGAAALVVLVLTNWRTPAACADSINPRLGSRKSRRESARRPQTEVQAAAWQTVSIPWTSACRYPWSRRSPTRTSQSVPAGKRLGSRHAATTLIPSQPLSASRMWLPTNPVAPVTSTVCIAAPLLIWMYVQIY